MRRSAAAATQWLAVRGRQSPGPAARWVGAVRDSLCSRAPAAAVPHDSRVLRDSLQRQLFLAFHSARSLPWMAVFRIGIPCISGYGWGRNIITHVFRMSEILFRMSKPCCGHLTTDISCVFFVLSPAVAVWWSRLLPSLTACHWSSTRIV